MHTLYRFYNTAGDLLYVGITNNPPGRFGKHRQEKQWWSNVARITLEQYETRAELAQAESLAIRAERPIHNVRGNKDAIIQRLVEASPPRGVRVGEVYAFALKDGTCPVGLVIEGDPAGVTIDRYSWMIRRFTAGEEWIAAESISRYRRADKRIDGKYTVFEMDALGDYQTEWTDLNAKVREHLA